MRFLKTAVKILLLATLLVAPLTAEEEKPRDIQFTSDVADYDENLNRVRLVGNVIITSEGSKLSAPYAVYYTLKQYAEFLGGVKMVGEQSTATGKEMRVWYGETRARLEGNVRLVSQKASDGEDQEPTIILAETLDYDWTEEEGAASGKVKMRQGIKRAFCDRAEIYQKKNEVLLLGNVRVEQGNGDWLTAQRAIYDTEKQTVRAEGRVVAKTKLEQKKDEPQDAGPGPGKRPLPQPTLEEPAFELLPMRRLPSVPLPWLDRESVTE